jgi:hypothetical protein
MSEVPATAPGAVIVAKAARVYRWKRYALVIFIFVYGLYSVYDGFRVYPRDNQKAIAQGLEKLPHPGYDVQFNQVMGVALPPLALIFLCWVAYASRGRYEFDGQTLSVPGHRNVSVRQIKRIDREKWDRKGIAHLHYQIPGNAKLAVITLDDFIYEQLPTDEIFKQISTAVTDANKVAPVNAVPSQRAE